MVTVTGSHSADEATQVLRDRLDSAWSLQWANYRYADRLNVWSLATGYAVTVLTTAAGTTALTDLSKGWAKGVVAGLSGLAALITAIRTAAKWGDRAAQHRKAAHAYGEIRYDLEQRLPLDLAHDDPKKAIEGISAAFGRADAQCPEMPERWYGQGHRHVAAAHAFTNA